MEEDDHYHLQQQAVKQEEAGEEVEVSLKEAMEVQQGQEVEEFLEQEEPLQEVEAIPSSFSHHLVTNLLEVTGEEEEYLTTALVVLKIEAILEVLEADFTKADLHLLATKVQLKLVVDCFTKQVLISASLNPSSQDFPL